MPQSEQILVTGSGGVTEIVLNRPEKKNAITVEMYLALEAALREAATPVIVLSGAGSMFTAGNDLGDFLNAPPRTGDSAGMTFLRTLATCPKILIAAVEGAAIGIGTTLLLHCDFVVAGCSAQFHMPFLDLALVPEAASTLLLPQMVGHQKAAKMLMLGEPFGPADAPFVTHIADDRNALTIARDLAQKLAAKPHGALLTTKALMKGSPEAVLNRITEEGIHFARQLQSAEAKAVFERFLSKRSGK